MIAPLFSIIITILNGEKTIKACLDSIAAQTFKSYEVILVDGGSTDSTLDLIKSNALPSTVEIKPRCGLYEGLNIGINLSKGHWLYFMGCDDQLYETSTLESVANHIFENEVISQLILGNVYCASQKEFLYPKIGSPYLMRFHIHHQGIFYQKALFENFKYNENRRIAADYEFNLVLGLRNISKSILQITFCKFQGEGISETQLATRNKEIVDIHHKKFGPVSSIFVNIQFYIRTKIGRFLRKNNLFNTRSFLKRIFN